MSTNPNNTVGTNAAYSGRTSVNAFNDGLAAYSRGVLSGWACSPSTGLKVQLGGASTVRDVAVAVDNAGNRTTINNISGAPIEMTISAAPSTNSRIDAIVAYVDNPAEGVSTVADNPAACGMIVVKGTAAASPVEPNETMIRSAITADGASGVTAYYAVLATVKIASGTTDLTSANIAAGPSAAIGSQNIDWTTLEKREVTVTLDSTGNQSLNILISDYLIISCYQKPSSNMKNGNFTCYSWNDGKYQVHGDMNYGGGYVTGSVTLILTLLKRN